MKHRRGLFCGSILCLMTLTAARGASLRDLSSADLEERIQNQSLKIAFHKNFELLKEDPESKYLKKRLEKALASGDDASLTIKCDFIYESESSTAQMDHRSQSNGWVATRLQNIGTSMLRLTFKKKNPEAEFMLTCATLRSQSVRDSAGNKQISVERSPITLFQIQNLLEDSGIKFQLPAIEPTAPKGEVKPRKSPVGTQ